MVDKIPPSLLARLTDPEPPPKAAPSPNRNSGFSAADYVREHFDWHTYLGKYGWTHDRGEYWVRPGKNPRDGHSAVLHDSGALVVFTTEVPSWMERMGVPTSDGTGLSYSLFRFIAAHEFGGDERECARWVWQQYGPTRPPRLALVAGNTPEEATANGPASLNLPAAFWESRPQLAHIFLAARSAGCSPDSLLVHAIARTATFIHPCYKLPGVEQGLIGKQQTLDFMGCVVAETSGGKTLAAGVGELLIPQPEPPTDGTDPVIDFEQKVGSGEGIAEFFLVPRKVFDEDGKEKVVKGEKVIGKQALFMSVDEGTGFTNQAGRKGATIVQTLASAWSGEALGQLNSADETRRLVRAGRVRVCAVINMQESMGFKLYAPELETVGFTGRLLFAWVHDPSAPKDRPPWPGPLKWPVAPDRGTNQYFSYDDEITAEIWETRHGILTTAIRIEPRQSQYLLLRCKVAAVLATWDDRLHITNDDWTLATRIVAMSSAVLGHLDVVHLGQVEGTAVTASTFKLRVAEKAQTMHTRQLAVGWRARGIERLRKQGPLPWKGLKDIVESGPYRDVWRGELELMVSEGVLGKDGARYLLA